MPFEFCHDLWHQKTSPRGYGIICVILSLAVLIQYRSVTNTHTQTDRRTDRHMTTAYIPRDNINAHSFMHIAA